MTKTVCVETLYDFDVLIFIIYSVVKEEAHLLLPKDVKDMFPMIKYTDLQVCRDFQFIHLLVYILYLHSLVKGCGSQCG